MTRPLFAKSRVILTLEICPDDTWGAECTVAQAQKQGAESALRLLEELIAGESRVRIVGAAKVVVVALSETP